MSKLSVKKPFTVLVAVIIVLALGYVSVTRVTTDLLPPIDVPFMMVITPYPGASPEKVESLVTEPLERSLGTVSGVKNVYSVSAENYSMVQLEFVDGTGMDKAALDISNKLNQMNLPDGVGTSSMLELSMDMIATMYVAVDREGYDIYELSSFVKDTAAPYLERVEGVANVSNLGLVEKTVQVELDGEKIRDVNDRLLAKVSDSLDEARKQLDEAKEKVEEGQKELEKQQASCGDTLSSGIFEGIDSQIGPATSQVKDSIRTVRHRIAELAWHIEQSENTSAARQEEAVQRAAELQAAAEEAAGKAAEAAEAAAQAAQSATEAAQTAAEDAAESTMEEALPEIGESVTEAAQDGELSAEELQAVAEQLQAAAEQAAAEAAEAAQEAAGQSLTETLPDLSAYTDLLAQADAILETAENMDGSTLAGLMRLANHAVRAIPYLTQAVNGMQTADTSGSLADPLWQMTGSMDSLLENVDQIPQVLAGLQTAYGQLTEAQLLAAVGFSQAATQLTTAQAQLSAAESQYESAREEALENANLDALLNAATLSGMIYAQNFSMPAGYIDDENDNSWLLKVGDEFETPEDLSDTLLADVDGIGTVRISDVANVTVIDNADKSYTNLNGHDAILMCVYKSSTAGTNEVSRQCNAALKELEENQPGTEAVVLMDQGTYITLIVRSILRSMILGAILAIVILALFLWDVRPTFVVGISIPLSVMFTIVLMYFSDLSLNMMTLSGLALGIGMLVDNSIVVMENIFRLRSRGISAPRAAVQGAKQVFGAITASTLTTVCVFAPMVFPTGMVRQLLVPMALAITYCLTASLIVALTVVPASASTILRKVNHKHSRLFDAVQRVYGRTLAFCLRFKIVPLAVAIGLLALTVYDALRTGIVMFPDMTSNYIEVDITTDAELTREESYAQVDDVMQAVISVEGVSAAGIMDMSSTAGLVSAGFGLGSDSYGSYLCYVTVPDGMTNTRIREVSEGIREATKDLPAKVSVSASAMGDMQAFISSGMEVEVYGTDMEKIKDISRHIAEILEKTEGFKNVRDGISEGDQVLHLVIDKDKAMEKGFTVAEIYSGISQRLTTSVTSTTVTIDDATLDVVILDELHPLTKENLLDMEFTPSSQMSMSGMGAMAPGSGFDMSGGMGFDAGSSSGAGQTGDFTDMFSSFLGEEESDDEGSGGDEDEPENEKEEEKEPKKYRLGDFAHVEETTGPTAINRLNQARYLTVTAGVEEGYNVTLLTREVRDEIEAYNSTLPHGYSAEIAGESSQISEMLTEMAKMMTLALLFVYLVMVAQFQSLLSPFIILFTVPLAFTGGMLGLKIAGQQMTMLALMGFLILMGTVVNNGIVFVDYTNQLRIGGLKRHEALIAAGKTRMRPILMTALTTILAMGQLIFGDDMGAQLGSGMAVVIAGGLIYATLMTLYIIPVLYDIMFKKPPLNVNVDDSIDDIPDDASEYLEQQASSGVN